MILFSKVWERRLGRRALTCFGPVTSPTFRVQWRGEKRLFRRATTKENMILGYWDTGRKSMSFRLGTPYIQDKLPTCTFPDHFGSDKYMYIHTDDGIQYLDSTCDMRRLTCNPPSGILPLCTKPQGQCRKSPEMTRRCIETFWR